MCPDMLSGIPSDILSRKYSAILPEVCPDALRDMYYVHFGIPSGILSDRYSGILSGVSSGTGLLPDIYSEKICDMSTEIYSDNF